jgi:hypothetical protein
MLYNYYKCLKGGGMPRKDEYIEETFLPFITKKPKSTLQIQREINKKFSTKLSWNTVDKYLRKLAEKGKIMSRRVSDRFNFWYVGEVGKVGESGRKPEEVSK